MYWKPASMTKNAVAASDTAAPAVRSELKTLTMGPVFTASTPVRTHRIAVLASHLTEQWQERASPTNSDAAAENRRGDCVADDEHGKQGQHAAQGKVR